MGTIYYVGVLRSIGCRLQSQVLLFVCCCSDGCICQLDGIFDSMRLHRLVLGSHIPCGVRQRLGHRVVGRIFVRRLLLFVRPLSVW